MTIEIIILKYNNFQGYKPLAKSDYGFITIEVMNSIIDNEIRSLGMTFQLLSSF